LGAVLPVVVVFFAAGVGGFVGDVFLGGAVFFLGRLLCGMGLLRDTINERV